MAIDINEEELKAKYANFSDDEIRKEYNEILAIPNARTNIEALTRMSFLLPELEKRGMKEASTSSRSSASTERSSSVNSGTAILGVVLIIGGLILSANTGRLFYGAILVGGFMLIKSFI